MTHCRTGIGYDIHRLEEGRRLVLGGVQVPHAKGLLGHSDGDVLIHAVIDALLGAMGEKDIGQCFPDTNPHLALIVSHHGNNAEVEFAATFDHLGDTRDVYHALIQFVFR